MALDHAEHLGQLVRIIGRPAVLRSQPHACAVGAAAVVRIAVGRGRGPGRLDQFADGEARTEDRRLETGDFGIGRHRAGGHRILPDQVFGRNFRAEVTDLRPHVAVAQLEPRAGEGIVQRLGIGEEAFGNLAIFRIVLQRHVGGGHHRRHLLRRVARVGGHVFFGLADWLPLVGTGRRFHQFIVILEQQPEIVVAPAGGVVRPRALDARGGDIAGRNLVLIDQPAEALQVQILAFGCAAEGVGRGCAVGLAEGVATGGKGNGFLVVHRHAGKGFAHVAGHAFMVMRVALRPFGIDVDEAHLDRGERAVDGLVLGRNDARFDAFVDPLAFGAPVDALRLVDVGAAAAEAEHRSAHRFNRDVPGEDEQIGPADVLAVFLLDRPQQAAGLVEVAVVRPGIERSETLLPAIGPAAPVAGAIGARSVPCHADEERAVVPIVRRPPRLAVGHQRGEVGLQSGVIEGVERLGIVEFLAIGVRTAAPFGQDVELQRLGPPVAVGAAQQAPHFGGPVERTAAAHFSGLGIHRFFLLSSVVVSDSPRGQAYERKITLSGWGVQSINARGLIDWGD